MRVAFDIGGTFTDVILLGDDGSVSDLKTLSLLDEVGPAITQAVALRSSHAPVDRFVHATTICSNALIQGNTARVGLITTRGFRDTLMLRAQKGTNNPQLDWEAPEPVVLRRLTHEVDERILADGRIDRPLDEDQCRKAIQALVDAGVGAIAVCLINGYLNSEHEQRIYSLVTEIAPSMPVCLSSALQPEVREYERMSTTAINTSLIPVVDDYLSRLENHLATLSNRLLIMQSNGGVMSSEAARRRPVYMMESGPAAGALAAARVGTRLGLDKVLAFDMGGTTAKACLIQNGTPLERQSGEVGSGEVGTSSGGGHAVRVPMIDLVEVGAGGGSIAWSDGHVIRVGPESAGAAPGPVCYGRGGTRPTVTDANIVLGTMHPSELAGGTMRVDREAAYRAVAEFGAQLGLDPLDTADGIVQIAVIHMMRALRAVSTERGHDPREFTLMAFGGSGPLHAVALAEALDMSRIVIPPFPGVFSAFGLLLADYRLDFVSSQPTLLANLNEDPVLRQFAELEEQAFGEFAAQGVDPKLVRFMRSIDLRYNYQIDDLPLEFPEQYEPGSLAKVLGEHFRAAHEREFGYVGEGDIVAVNLRLRALANENRFDVRDLAATRPAVRPPATEDIWRDVYFGQDSGTLRTRVCARSDIGDGLHGPLIIEEPDTTIVVRPGWRAVSGGLGEVLLSRDQ